MAAFSNLLENELLDHVLRNESYTAPSSVWIALHTADNGLESGTITGEVSGGAYARIEVGGSSGRNFTAAASGSSSNAQAITFPTATANWGTVTHVSIMTASTAGSVLFHGAMVSNVTVNTNDIFEFAIGDLQITLD